MTNGAQKGGSTPSFDRTLLVILAAAWVLLFGRLGIGPVSDYDAWLHLRIGEFLNDGGRFAGRPDPWSATAIHQYIPTQWLPERFGAEVFKFAGLPGVALLRSLAALGHLLALMWLGRQVADPVPAAIAAGAGFIGSAGALTDRPQALALVLLTVIVAGWWQSLSDGRPRWWIVAVSWVLTMTHGLWFVGVLIGLLFAVVILIDGRSVWRQRLCVFLVPAASLGAAGLTPLGPALILSPLQVARGVNQYVQEWQPVDTLHPLFLIAMSLTAIIVSLWLRRGGTPASRGLILAAAVVCVIWSGRTVAVGAILLAGLLAEALQSLRHRTSQPIALHDARHWGITAALIAAVCVFMAPRVAGTPERVPVELAGTISALPAETVVLPAHELSGWIMWEAPHVKVTFDLRSEIYSGEQIEAYLAGVAARPGWEDYVRDTEATYALLADDAPLAEALERSGWVPTASSGGYTLLSSRP